MKTKWFEILLFIGAYSALGLTPLKGADVSPGALPFRIRGDLNADFGWETPQFGFRQNTQIRLYTQEDIAPNISAEIQLYLTQSSTDNQFSNSIIKGSFLDQSLNDFLDSVPNPINDSANSGDSIYQRLLKVGEIALNSRIIPKLSILLDRANIKYRGRFLDIAIGRQVVAWGSGYAWNPTDAINLRNPLDPTEPRKGVGAVVVDLPFREWFLLTFAMAPSKTFEESTQGIRLKFTINSNITKR